MALFRALKRPLREVLGGFLCLAIPAQGCACVGGLVFVLAFLFTFSRIRLRIIWPSAFGLRLPGPIPRPLWRFARWFGALHRVTPFAAVSGRFADRSRNVKARSAIRAISGRFWADFAGQFRPIPLPWELRIKVGKMATVGITEREGERPHRGNYGIFLVLPVVLSSPVLMAWHRRQSGCQLDCSQNRGSSAPWMGVM